MDEVVTRLYETYPFPRFTTLSVPSPEGYALGRLNYVLRRRRESRLRQDFTMWIAGCGTMQTALWAASFPKARILATDLSEPSLRVAARAVSELGARNVEFLREDLFARPPESRFDLIGCTGVLHHLSDPARGLRKLHEHLAPGGAARLMVYNSLHRHEVNLFQELLEVLVPRTADLTTRRSMALKLVQVLAASPNCEPLHTFIRSFDWNGNPELFADTLLHPREVAYTVDAVDELVGRAGLRRVAWVNRHAWELAPYTQDPEMLERFSRLNARGRDKMIQLMGGIRSPLMDFYVESEREPAQADYSEEEFLALRLRLFSGYRDLRIENGRVVSQAEVAGYSVSGDQIICEATSEGGNPLPARLVLNAEWERALKAFDGERDVRSILLELSPRYGREALLALISRLLSTDAPMLFPVFD